jgi:CubicO group peptidase (beta-lactamase class C family)
MTTGSAMTVLHDTLAPHVDSGEIPAVVALVARGGDVQVEALGRLHDGGPPVARDTVFRISSMTKPVVAVAAMQLVAEGVVDLDDPVDGLLPELAHRRVLTSLDAPLDDTLPAERPITVLDLLTFRMGMGLVLAPPGTYPVQRAMDELQLAQGAPGTQVPPEPDEWMRRLGTLPLLHQPGERWMYSTGSDVLGVLVARAAARPLGDVLRERIFTPLGMRDTGFSVPAASMGRFVTAYVPGDGGRTVSDDPATGSWSREPAFPSGAGGLVSTVDDYLAFTEMLRTGGGEILPPSAVREMTRDHLGPGQSDGILLSDGEGWGLGLAVDAVRGRHGWDGGLGTSWYSYPDVTGILLTQVAWTVGPPAIRADFWAAVGG